jgi:hypothetical protein
LKTRDRFGPDCAPVKVKGKNEPTYKGENMNFNNFAKRSGLGINIAGLLLTAGSMMNTASAQAPVVIKNTIDQSVPITGYVVASTRPDTEAVQIDLVASFSYNDVAPKGTFTIPDGKEFHLEHVSAFCHSQTAVIAQNFALRLGTGQNRLFSWFMVAGALFNYPSFGVTMFGSISMPLRGTFDGPIWVDGLRPLNVGGDTACNVVLLGYYTKIQPQLAQ